MSAFFAPNKTYAPLCIDTDAVLTAANKKVA
jgi:hypothetical protein